MSNLAKVFIVFNLILSVLFFGTAATLFKTRTSWKSAYEDLKKTNEKGVKELGDYVVKLNGQIVGLDKTVQAQNANADKLSKDNKQLRQDVTAEQAKVSSANSAREKADVLSQQIAKNLEAETQRNQQVVQEREAAKTAHEAALAQLKAANEERDSMKLDLAKTQEALSDSKKEYKSLTEKADDMEIRLAAIMEKYGNFISVPDKIQPPIDALVSAVDKNEPLVVLSVGKNLNVEPGFKFTVARGGEFVGKVEVIKVYPSLSGARILYTKDGQQIQRGDKAITSQE